MDGMTPIPFLFRTLLLLGISLTTANAHHLWIEQDDTSVKLYFGEFGNNLREASPGLLDRFVQPLATLVTPEGERNLSVEKGAQAFTLGAKIVPGQSIIAQEAKMPIREKKEGDTVIRTASHPAARLITDFQAQPARLPLDLVPTGKGDATSGYEFALTFLGKPLTRTKVEIVTASGWGRTVTTDEEGKFTAGFPWLSTYVIEAHHIDPTPGERDGNKFDNTSYTTALSFTLTSGLTPPKPPQAMKPH